MNISKRDIKLLLILFGLVIFVLLYFLVYLVKSEENEFLLDDIQDADNELTFYMSLRDEVAGYAAAVDESIEFIRTSEEAYPTDLRTENLIMYAVELQESLGVSTGGITFIQPVEVLSVQGIDQNDDGSYFFLPRRSYRAGINMNMNMTYQQLKDLIEYVYADSPVTSIQSVSLSYNSSTGLLFGNVVINKNFLSSHDGEYTLAEIPDMTLGLPNPFGVVSRPAPAPRPASNPNPTATE